MDVQYANLYQQGVFYITAARYYLSCWEEDSGLDGGDVFNGQQETIDWIADGGGGGLETVTCSAGYTLDEDTQTCVEDKINNNLTDPCAKSVFNELKIEMLKKKLKASMNPDGNINLTFAESILKLFNDSNSIHLTIQNGTLNDANANTVGATITISDSYLANATQLSIARTMIHESVHAYLNVKYRNYITLNDWNFKAVMDKYAKDNGYKPDGTQEEQNKFQHEFMGQYINAMAISLLNWDVRYGTGGIKTKDSSNNDILDWEYYKTMAFSGQFQVDNNDNIISETYSFKALVPIISAREEIVKKISNEKNGNNKAKGEKCQ